MSIYSRGILMQMGILVVCALLLFSGCAGLTIADHDFPTKVAIHQPSFDIHKATGAKFSILPVRDLSNHYAVDYPAAVMNTFIKEVKRKSPELLVSKPDSTASLMASAGKRAEYQIFVNNCNDNIKYCPTKEELVVLFRNSGIRYVITLIIGKFDIPVPGVSMAYSLSVTIYDIDHGGDIVYQATCEGSAYSEHLEDGAAAFMNSVMEDATSSIVAKMYTEDEIQKARSNH